MDLQTSVDLLHVIWENLNRIAKRNKRNKTVTQKNKISTSHIKVEYKKFSSDETEDELENFSVRRGKPVKVTQDVALKKESSLKPKNNNIIQQKDLESKKNIVKPELKRKERPVKEYSSYTYKSGSKPDCKNVQKNITAKNNLKITDGEPKDFVKINVLKNVLQPGAQNEFWWDDYSSMGESCYSESSSSDTGCFDRFQFSRLPVRKRKEAFVIENVPVRKRNETFVIEKTQKKPQPSRIPRWVYPGQEKKRVSITQKSKIPVLIKPKIREPENKRSKFIMEETGITKSKNVEKSRSKFKWDGARAKNALRNIMNKLHSGTGFEMTELRDCPFLCRKN